jgi:hypothetical protein
MTFFEALECVMDGDALAMYVPHRLDFLFFDDDGEFVWASGMEGLEYRMMASRFWRLIDDQDALSAFRRKIEAGRGRG